MTTPPTYQRHHRGDWYVVVSSEARRLAEAGVYVRVNRDGSLKMWERFTVSKRQDHPGAALRLVEPTPAGKD